MIKSMTGYGRAAADVDNMQITAEIKAVNHRYFEFSSRIPRQFGFLDEKIKSYVASKVSRGKIEVYVTINMLESSATEVQINRPLAQAYKNALDALAADLNLRNDLSAMDIAKYSDVLSVHKDEEDEQAVTAAVIGVLENAVKSFVNMREIEGERLKKDVVSRCDFILEKVSVIETLSPETVKAYRQKLETKIHELLGDANVDEQRLLTETAIFADKVAVDEETVRLRSHISQLKNMLDGNDAIGRKLDFIVQEMNRETNTIGSKASNVEITKIVVDMKAEIEKIREQIQNIE